MVFLISDNPLVVEVNSITEHIQMRRKSYIDAQLSHRAPGMNGGAAWILTASLGDISDPDRYYTAELAIKTDFSGDPDDFKFEIHFDYGSCVHVMPMEEFMVWRDNFIQHESEEEFQKYMNQAVVAPVMNMEAADCYFGEMYGWKPSWAYEELKKLWEALNHTVTFTVAR